MSSARQHHLVGVRTLELHVLLDNARLDVVVAVLGNDGELSVDRPPGLLAPRGHLGGLEVEPALELGDADTAEGRSDGGGKLVAELVDEAGVRGEVVGIGAEDWGQLCGLAVAEWIRRRARGDAMASSASYGSTIALLSLLLTLRSLARPVELGPELCELAGAHEVVQSLEEGHGDCEALVVAVNVVHDRGRLAEQREADVEVGAVDGGAQRLDKDVEDDVGVGELGVELVAGVSSSLKQSERRVKRV